MNSTSFASILFRFAVTGAVGLGTIYFSLGRMAAEKIATAVAMPSGLLWLLLLFFAAYSVAIRQKASGLCLLICWLLLTLIGNRNVSDYLAYSLERPYVSLRPLEESPFDVVIVLGGGGTVGANSRMQGHVSGDRLILAGQMYHRGLAKSLVCTGKRIESMDSSGSDPCDVSREILEGLGVPKESIRTSGGRNTAEEMQGLGTEFNGTKLRVGVLTSAWHMPRAMRLASRNGFEPVPLPADFRSQPENNPPTTGELIESMIPSGSSIWLNGSLFKEYLGMLIGR
jgi:uncharacterized SAM-binding protein YcdF (DUF218 family)